MIASLTVFAAGCGLQDLRHQAMTAAGAAYLAGTVVTEHQGVVRVLLSEVERDDAAVINFAVLNEGRYEFYALPGSYLVSAYVDVNGNERFDEGEPGAVYGEAGTPTPVDLEASVRVVLPELLITDAPVDLPAVEDGKLALSALQLGEIADLSDSRFSRASASLGMWRPMDYLVTLGGGIYFLEAFDPAKVPVVYIHGINGTARDFEATITSLDRTRFQPWVLQYPSGLNLDIVSTYLLRSLDTLHERHGFQRVVVVAHSMGGLITRSFALKYGENEHPWNLSLVVTINSPLKGMPSASLGVDHSPIVVPAWRDLDPDSEFLAKLHRTWWPVDVPYRLVFSYLPGKAGDGVAPLDRQLSRQLQEEALSIHGFEQDHVGTLSDPDFLELLDVWLSAVAEAEGFP